jgi:selenocysteine lyase/cysteine desulfurase
MLNLRDPKEDAVVFITEAEHHSNDLPWRHLPIDLVVIPVDKTTGLVELPTLRHYLKKYSEKALKLISFIAVSNITGVIQPLDEICKLGHANDALVMFDFATGSPYLPIKMSRDDESGNYIDIITVSTHKFLGGPTTPGVLVFKTTCCRNDVPFCPGGGTVRFVTSSFQKYSDDLETRENGGTPNIVGCIRAGLSFNLKDKYQELIKTRELWLVQYVQEGLLALGDKIELLNPVQNTTRIPIFSFRVPNFHYNYIVTLLNDLFGIQTRGGISCCSMYAQKLLGISSEKKKEIYKSITKNKGVPGYYGWCRITFHYSMPRYIVDYILRAVEYVVNYAANYRHLYVYDAKKNLWYNNSGQANPAEVDMAKIRAEILDTLVTNTLEIAGNIYPTPDDLEAIFTLNRNSLPAVLV